MIFITNTNRMQNDPIVSRASELMRLGLMPSAQQLRGDFVRRVSLQATPFMRTVLTRFYNRICLRSTFRRRRRGIECKPVLDPLFATSTCIVRVKCIDVCCVGARETPKLLALRLASGPPPGLNVIFQPGDLPRVFFDKYKRWARSAKIAHKNQENVARARNESLVYKVRSEPNCWVRAWFALCWNSKAHNAGT